MTVVLMLVGFVVGAGGGSLVTHRLHRQHTAGLEDLELKADMCDWFRDCADRLVDQLDTAEHALDCGHEDDDPAVWHYDIDGRVVCAQCCATCNPKESP